MRIISYGGGVQSTALVVLSAQGIIDFSTAVFSNVGDDSEDPRTLAYVRDIIIPWAAEHDVDVVELQREPTRGRFAGQSETLYQRLLHPDSRSVGIPVRMGTGAPGRRSCTIDFKIRVVDRWLTSHGASEANPADVAIGFSTDEVYRVPAQPRGGPQHRIYPLLDLGYDRARCQTIIASAGLPVPPKSSCYFCPFHSAAHWSELRRDRPELFERAALLEDTLNDRRARLGKDRVYMHRRLIPLREAVTAAQDPLFDADDTDGLCDDGFCFV